MTGVIEKNHCDNLAAISCMGQIRSGEIEHGRYEIGESCGPLYQEKNSALNSKPRSARSKLFQLLRFINKRFHPRWYARECSLSLKARPSCTPIN